MSPELVGIITLFGTVVALGAALFGTLKWFANYIDKRFEQVDKRFEQVDKCFEQMERRFERIERDISDLKEGLARLEGMFEGAFERVPRARPGDPQGGPRQSLPRAACRRNSRLEDFLPWQTLSFSRMP